jgi:GNAT superfamily N-acetyltransferase
LVTWDRKQLGRRRDEVLEVYAEAMAVTPTAARSRRPIVTAHLERRGLRTVAAVDDDDRLVGVAYGYLGAPGEWWHDQVRAALSDDDAARWLSGAFEVCELHVRPPMQGQGIGRQLLNTLLTGPPARTAVLTTPDKETRARRFYRAAGWTDLVRNLVFPADPRAFAVLGKELRA